MQPKRYKTDVFLAVFAVMVSLLLITAIFSYTSLIRFSREKDNQALPQQKLFLLGSILNELQTAENSIRAFRLSQSAQWLQDFYTHSGNCVQQLDEFLTIANVGHDEKPQLFQKHIQAKLEILEEYSDLPDRAVVIDELESISRRIDNVIQEEEEEPEARSGGFIRNLFTRSNNREVQKPDTIAAIVMEELAMVRTRQSSTLQTIDARELEFLSLINVKNADIEAVAEDLRAQVLIDVEQASQARENEQIQAMRNIRLFSLTAALFLLLGGYAVYRFTIKRRQYEKALLLARQNAEAYSAMQERFVANMSHEVRTPLHAIAGFTEQLSLTRQSQKQKEFLTLMQSAIKHLLQVVNDILDYSKLKAGKMKLRLTAFSPASEAKTVVELFDQQAQSKGITLTLQQHSTLPAELMGDALRYRQVIVNLLSNAIKFTEQGNITLEIEHKKTGGKMVNLLTTVTDSGTGMTEQQLENIFQPFEQAEAIDRKPVSGTGLGLTITREIIDQQGGTITINSQPGKGTNVSFSIPFMLYQDEETGSEASDAPKHFSLEGIKVLIADDEEWNRKLLNNILERYGADVHSASDGLAAFKKLQKCHYNLALLDIRMPGLTGLEIAQRITLSDKHQNLVMLALTALASPDSDTEIISTGFQAVISKPFTENELISALSNHIKPGGNTTHSTSCSQYETARENLFCKESIEKMGNGNHQFIREMIEIFIRNSAEYVQHILKAIEAEDKEKLLWHTHKMAPPARHIKAVKILEQIKYIENKAKEATPLSELEDAAANLMEHTTKLSAALKQYYLK